MKTGYPHSPELKHRIPMQGEYNEYVSDCQECEFTLWDIKDSTTVTIGWFELNGEWMITWECPKCFTKWYHHDRTLELYRHHLIVENIKE